MNRNDRWSCDLCGNDTGYDNLLVVTNLDRNPPQGPYTSPIRADVCQSCWRLIVDKMVGAGWARRQSNGI